MSSIFLMSLSLYIGPEAVAFFEDRLQDYEVNKGTVRFSYDKPLPLELINMVSTCCKLYQIMLFPVGRHGPCNFFFCVWNCHFCSCIYLAYNIRKSKDIVRFLLQFSSPSLNTVDKSCQRIPDN